MPTAKIKKKVAKKIKSKVVPINLKFAFEQGKSFDINDVSIIPDENGKTIPELFDGLTFNYCTIKFRESQFCISRNLTAKRNRKPVYFAYHPDTNNTATKTSFWSWSVRNNGFKNNTLIEASQIVEKFYKKIRLELFK